MLTMFDPLSCLLAVFIALLLSFLVFFVLRSRPDDSLELRTRRTAFVQLSHQKEVTLVSSISELSTAWDSFASELRGVVGLDCEWTTRNDHVGAVALLQLALPTGHCLLIRTCSLEEPPRSAFPPSLLEMLADPKVLKFGVAVPFDADKMMTDFGVRVRGCVDLRHLVVRVRNNGLTRRGLKNIAKVWLGIEYESGKDVQCSVWDQPELSPVQVEYAALDSLVAVFAVAEFLYRRNKLPPAASLEQLRADLAQLGTETIRPLCQGVIDSRFRAKKQESRSNHLKDKVKFSRIPERKTPLYTNAVMQAPDGELLCLLDVKKARWYLSKGLATLVEDGEGSKDSGVIIRLKFEPESRETGPDWEYYLNEKENRCVVCGSEGPLARKHVVPLEYRRCFPRALRWHRSHDVLLFCLACHRQGNLLDDALKRQLAAEFDAPMGTRANVAFLKDDRTVGVLRAAKALRTAGDRLPEARKRELQEKVVAYYEDDGPASFEECMRRLEENPPSGSVPNESFVAHGAAVVAELTNQKDGVRAFEMRWRRHFVDNMRPKFLPEGWSVHHGARDLQ